MVKNISQGVWSTIFGPYDINIIRVFKRDHTFTIVSGYHLYSTTTTTRILRKDSRCFKNRTIIEKNALAKTEA